MMEASAGLYPKKVGSKSSISSTTARAGTYLPGEMLVGNPGSCGKKETDSTPWVRLRQNWASVLAPGKRPAIPMIAISVPALLMYLRPFLGQGFMFCPQQLPALLQILPPHCGTSEAVHGGVALRFEIRWHGRCYGHRVG